ncbi:MAG: glycosyltransferase family 4 protein [Armatimonadota bacterium]|nr:glycosyltransferase family 4 protein [bacterium]
MIKPLRTIHIDSEMGWSGGQRQVSALCAYLHEQGHAVAIICQPGSKLEEWARSKGIESIPVRMRSTLSLGSVLKMRSIMAWWMPDVVHLHASRAHILGSAAARLAGVKKVLATRRQQDAVHMVWPNTSAYGSWTTVMVAISEAVRDVLIECGVDPGKIRVIRSGCDVDAFTSAQADPTLQASFGANGFPLVCTAAFLSERKGINYLIEAASLLKDFGTPVHLVIAGEGERRVSLEAQANDLGIRATFLGYFSDTPRLLASTNIFVMPSLSEGLGVAALEAMAAGKPVIASAVGGLRESVVDGVTGYHVPPADPRALADAIRKLLADPNISKRMGAAGQARMRELYSLNNMAQSNEALYQELLNR